MVSTSVSEKGFHPAHTPDHSLSLPAQLPPFILTCMLSLLLANHYLYILLSFNGSNSLYSSQTPDPITFSSHFYLVLLPLTTQVSDPSCFSQNFTSLPICFLISLFIPLSYPWHVCSSYLPLCICTGLPGNPSSTFLPFPLFIIYSQIMYPAIFLTGLFFNFFPILSIYVLMVPNI